MHPSLPRPSVTRTMRTSLTAEVMVMAVGGVFIGTHQDSTGENNTHHWLDTRTATSSHLWSILKVLTAKLSKIELIQNSRRICNTQRKHPVTVQYTRTYRRKDDKRSYSAKYFGSERRSPAEEKQHATTFALYTRLRPEVDLGY